MIRLVTFVKKYRFEIKQIMRNCTTISAIKPPFLKVFLSNYGGKTAIIDEYGRHSYREIIAHSTKLSENILSYAKLNKMLDSDSRILSGERIGFLCSNNVTYTIMQWAIWMSGGMAVPLAKSHPESELGYVVNDSQSFLLLCNTNFSEKLKPVAEQQNIFQIKVDDNGYFSQKGIMKPFNNFVESEQVLNGETNTDLESIWDSISWEQKNAMLVYTSGTTGRPKGVVTTFSNLQAQIEGIVDSWGMVSTDTSLHVLPLHHVHGIVNALACPLWSGGTCLMLPYFNAIQVWDHLLRNTDINVFHAIPTIYAMLIEYYDQHFTSNHQQKEIKDTLKYKMRLMVSGSAALPETIMKKWQDISGHTLLERYGMTEIGMALTNPLIGARVPGAVGKPFPCVQVRITSPDGDIITEGDHKKLVHNQNAKESSGSLLVKGPSVFKEYWNKPEATKETFSEDGWFITGDTALYDVAHGVIRILGRTSVDIIKSSGFKISALDVERVLLSHENIKEAIVVGLPDDKWGEIVTALVVLKTPSTKLDLLQLQSWASHKMAPYQVPRKLKLMDSIPRNAMGKVNKKKLVKSIH